MIMLMANMLKKKALEHFEDALKMNREIGCRYGEAIRLDNIGLTTEPRVTWTK
jgi:hypothetical protein